MDSRVRGVMPARHGNGHAGGTRMGVNITIVMVCIGLWLVYPMIHHVIPNVVTPAHTGVLYAREDDDKQDLIEIPSDEVRKAFEVGKQKEMTYKTLKGYFEGYVRPYLEKRLKFGIMVTNVVILDGGYEMGRPLPLLINYKDKHKVIEELAKKRKLDDTWREGISWFPTSYQIYLNMKGEKDKLRRLFNEYKRFIESNVEGVEVVPEKSYLTAVFKVDENLSREEKFKFAERIAERTTDFVYRHVTQDQELSYVKEMFEDFIKNSNTLDGFRYYKYEVTAPWGDEYTVKAYLSKYDDTQIELEVYIFKGKEIIAFDLVPYSWGKITNGKIFAIVDWKNLPVVAGFLKVDMGDKIRIGIIMAHESYQDRGKVYILDLYNDGRYGTGKADYQSIN